MCVRGRPVLNQLEDSSEPLTAVQVHLPAVREDEDAFLYGRAGAYVPLRAHVLAGSSNPVLQSAVRCNFDVQAQDVGPVKDRRDFFRPCSRKSMRSSLSTHGQGSSGPWSYHSRLLLRSYGLGARGHTCLRYSTN